MYSNLPWYGKALALVAFFAMGQSNPALAYWKSGNSIYERCETQTAFNFGYIQGVIDVLGDYHGMFCIPEDVIAKQLQDVVCKDLRERPQDRERVGSALVVESLQRAWPCK